MSSHAGASHSTNCASLAVRFWLPVGPRGWAHFPQCGPGEEGARLPFETLFVREDCKKPLAQVSGGAGEQASTGATQPFPPP